MERVVKWFDGPEEADEAITLHYANMTCQERLDEMIELLNTYGKWNERHLVRVAQFITVPK